MKSVEKIVRASVIAVVTLSPFSHSNLRADDKPNAPAEVKTYSFVVTVAKKYETQHLIDFSVSREELERQSALLFYRFRIDFDAESGKARTAYWLDMAGHKMELPQTALLFDEIPEKGTRLIATLDRTDYPIPPEKIKLLSLVPQGLSTAK